MLSGNGIGSRKSLSKISKLKTPQWGLIGIFGVATLAGSISCQPQGKDSSNAQSGQESEVDSFGSAVAAAAGTLSIDPLAISARIEKAVNEPRDREGFVKGVANETFYALQDEAAKKGRMPLNVMVFNLSIDHESSGLNGVEYYKTVQFKGENSTITYGVWGFSDGVFTNKGDGGFLNWYMIGWHDKVSGDGKKSVTFTRP